MSDEPKEATFDYAIPTGDGPTLIFTAQELTEFIHAAITYLGDRAPLPIGHWQREVPQKPGFYWCATLDGGDTTVRVVYEALDGTCKPVRPWGGWWWSEPIREPAPPTSEA